MPSRSKAPEFFHPKPRTTRPAKGEAVIVRITPTDLRDGESRSSENCAVARAFKRAYPHASLEGIAPDVVFVTWPGQRQDSRHDLNAKARAWLKDFDEGRRDQLMPGPLTLFTA